jgi:hypothetical protein
MEHPTTRGHEGRRRRTWAAFTAGVLLCAATSLLSPPASAGWARPQEVVIGTAHTLERGTFSIGVFEPLRYGALDSIMLGTRPVLHLLLTPNVTLRTRVLAEPLCISLQVGYVQSFLEERDGGFPGSAQGQLLVSVSLARRLSLTGSVGYAFGFFPTEHQLPMAFAVHALFSRSSMVMLQVAAVRSFTLDAFHQPNVQLLYAHAWSSFHLAAGVSVGRYEFLPWREVGVAIRGVPITPLVDAWWQF